MAKLLFQNSQGIERWIADCDTWDEVNKCIDLFIDQANSGRAENKRFKSYYRRMWEENNRTVIDVGSWSELFFWEKRISSVTMKEDGEAEFDYDN